MSDVFAAAIIPAYNEGATIRQVVAILRTHPLIHEVIVVSDGSTDQTVEVAEAAGARVYALKYNRGKGGAMLYGVQQTQAEILLFVDADLRGFSADHIDRLLLPVFHGARAMNIGIRDRGPFWTKITHYLPLISGERAMRREVIEGVAEEFLHGYMVESALNYYCRMHRLAYGAVDLPGLDIRRKFEKVPFFKAVVQYGQMYLEVAQAMVAVRIARIFGRF